RLPIRAAGRLHRPSAKYLLRALSEPPRAPDVLTFRRAVLADLAKEDGHRPDAEAVYAEIVRLRSLLCVGRTAARWLRRLEILRSVHAIFTLLATSFEGAESGLARLRTFGLAVQQSDAYQRLTAILDHEE